MALNSPAYISRKQERVLRALQARTNEPLAMQFVREVNGVWLAGRRQWMKSIRTQPICFSNMVGCCGLKAIQSELKLFLLV
jgi:hypothetical protein